MIPATSRPIANFSLPAEPETRLHRLIGARSGGPVQLFALKETHRASDLQGHPCTGGPCLNLDRAISLCECGEIDADSRLCRSCGGRSTDTADSWSMVCWTCGGFVCVGCGAKPVSESLMFCHECAMAEAENYRRDLLELQTSEAGIPEAGSESESEPWGRYVLVIRQGRHPASDRPWEPNDLLAGLRSLGYEAAHIHPIRTPGSQRRPDR